MSAHSSADPRLGSVLGAFRIERVLGRGGMGVVYQAVDERLHRQVAIKLLPPELSQSPESRARFLAEARIAAAVSHPCIATIYEVGGPDARVSPLFLDLLLRFPHYEANVRELDALLWQAIEGSRGDVLEAPRALVDAMSLPPEETRAAMSEERIRTALGEASGNVTAAAKRLQLPSRYSLYRLMKKHGIEDKPPRED